MVGKFKTGLVVFKVDLLVEAFLGLHFSNTLTSVFKTTAFGAVMCLILLRESKIHSHMIKLAEVVKRLTSNKALDTSWLSYTACSAALIPLNGLWASFNFS